MIFVFAVVFVVQICECHSYYWTFRQGTSISSGRSLAELSTPIVKFSI